MSNGRGATNRSRAVLKDLELLNEVLKHPGDSVKELSAKIGLGWCATREHIQVLATARSIEIGRRPASERTKGCYIIFPKGYLNAK